MELLIFPMKNYFHMESIQSLLHHKKSIFWCFILKIRILNFFYLFIYIIIYLMILINHVNYLNIQVNINQIQIMIILFSMVIMIYYLLIIIIFLLNHKIIKFINLLLFLNSFYLYLILILSIGIKIIYIFLSQKIENWLIHYL